MRYRAPLSRFSSDAAIRSRMRFMRRDSATCCSYTAFPSAKSDLPVRLSCKGRVQPLFEKFPASRFTQISFITPPSTPLEGRIAIVTDAGLDAMDAAALLTNSATADGEVVWS